MKNKSDVLKTLIYVVLGIIAILISFWIIKGIYSIILWFSEHILITILLSPFLVGGVIGLISGLCSIGDTGSYSDYTFAETSSKYDNQDAYGVSRGSSTVSGNNITHSDFYGVWQGGSEIKGDKIQHKSWYGSYDGVSEIKGNRIDHYGDIDEGYIYKGHSEIRDNGNIDHYDSCGVYTGTSKRNN